MLFFFPPICLWQQFNGFLLKNNYIKIKKKKNLFFFLPPPQKIYIIPEFLKTLPELDFKSGMGEMLHFYLVSGEEDFSFYQKYYEKAFTDEETLLNLVKRNLEIKKGFIERDEFDRGERQLLNYGHSFGHAIESLTNYTIPHGIAVSYGMDMANFISVKLCFIENDVRQRLRSQLEKVWTGTSLGNLNVNNFEKALSRDKKNIGNTYQVILTKGIGNMLKHGICPNEDFTNWLYEYFTIELI